MQFIVQLQDGLKGVLGPTEPQVPELLLLTLCSKAAHTFGVLDILEVPPLRNIVEIHLSFKADMV